ncbi:conserved protein of unknown function [Micropruina glycogenica]|uniref:Uncharacterized protein n=2 Tax=Micropruina glycogenica TaxID=75385 RepID=A0A2N9JCI3_9ACTN|nr:conserved protein of unknown function [Micropruina glycogenica]
MIMTQPAAPASDPIADLSKSPLPTAKTLKMRQSLPFQFTRFLSFNSRIMRMVIKGHH